MRTSEETRRFESQFLAKWVKMTTGVSIEKDLTVVDDELSVLHLESRFQAASVAAAILTLLAGPAGSGTNSDIVARVCQHCDDSWTVKVTR